MTSILPTEETIEPEQPLRKCLFCSDLATHGVECKKCFEDSLRIDDAIRRADS